MHPSYKATVLFQNTFDGQLPATDYPKVNVNDLSRYSQRPNGFHQFYFYMFLVYAIIGAAWGWLCYKNMNEILPIQYYLSGLVGLLVIEMVANWGKLN